MKKFKFLGKFLLMGMLLTTVNSCQNLDEELFSQLNKDTFFKSESDFISALGGCYTQLYNFCNHNTIWSIQEVSTDEFMIPQRGGDWFDGGQWIRIHRHEQTEKEESINNAWVFAYQGIALCNQFIEAAEAGSIQLGKDAIPEVKCIRAMYYFWILDLFGNAPIETAFIKTGTALPQTSSRAELYAFVENELRGSITSLTKSKSYGRMNYWAARALQAKLYLNAEVYTGTGKWAEALDAANDVINNSGHALEANYANNFNRTNNTSNENILSIPYDAVNAQGFNFPQMMLHYSSQASFNLQSQPWNGYCTLEDFYNSYEAGDARRANNFLAGQQYAADGVTPLEDANAEAGDPDGKTLVFTPQINEQFPNCLRQAGVRNYKFNYYDGGTPNLDNDFPILRLADIQLTKIECHWRLSQDVAAAQTMFDGIRSRAGVGTLALSADALLAERGREMFAEAWRRNDLIRFGKFDRASKWQADSKGADHNLFPIPGPQRNANPDLAQNPGY